MSRVFGRLSFFWLGPYFMMLGQRAPLIETNPPDVVHFLLHMAWRVAMIQQDKLESGHPTLTVWIGGFGLVTPGSCGR